jgi:hypothetical protein
MKVFYAIIRLDPAFDALLPKDANIEKVATGVIFTEGPVWRPEGVLWFSDVPGNVLRSVTPSGEVKVLIQNAGGIASTPRTWVPSSLERPRPIAPGDRTARRYTSPPAQRVPHPGRDTWLEASLSGLPVSTRGALMKRRSYLTAILAAIAGLKGVRAQPAAKNPIVLYCDLTVDPLTGTGDAEDLPHHLQTGR